MHACTQASTQAHTLFNTDNFGVTHSKVLWHNEQKATLKEITTFDKQLQIMTEISQKE
jgi:hypothetical protein